MLSYALRRLAGAVPTLFILVTLCFFIMRLAPGGPFDSERALPPAVEANLAAAYHLDETLPQQYLRYLGGLLRGDLGPSFQYPDRRVSEIVLEGLPVSAGLGLLAMLLAVLMGGSLGAMAALRRDRSVDHLSMGVAMIGISVPNFVIAPLLVLAFAIGLRWLPAGGWGTAQHLVLPVLVLALPQIAYLARLTRASLLDVLEEDYVRSARAIGLSETRILWRHALRPALAPVVSYLGPATAALITGSLVVEQIFGLPGIGRYFVQAGLNRDYTLVLGVVVFYGSLIIAANLLVDLIYAWLDPRVREAMR